MLKDTWWEEWLPPLLRIYSADNRSLLLELKRSSSVDSSTTEELNISNGRIRSPIVTQERVDHTISRLLPNSSGELSEECFLIRPQEEKLLLRDLRSSRDAHILIPTLRKLTFQRPSKLWDSNSEESSVFLESSASPSDGTRESWSRNSKRKESRNPNLSMRLKLRLRKKSTRSVPSPKRFNLSENNSLNMDFNKS